jgi:hypothetical protein
VIFLVLASPFLVFYMADITCRAQIPPTFSEHGGEEEFRGNSGSPAIPSQFKDVLTPDARMANFLVGCNMPMDNKNTGDQ